MRLASRLLAAGVAPILLPSPAFADPNDYVPVDAREVEPARPVAVLLPQSRIASSIELGRIMFPAGGGGALGLLIINGQNSIPERLAEGALERVETRIVPLLEALDSFDVAPLATGATQVVLENTPWLGAGPPELLSRAPEQPDGEGASTGVSFSNPRSGGLFEYESNQTEAAQAWVANTSDLQREFNAAHADAEEVAQFLWRYQMSPDFTQVQVVADVSLFRPGESEAFYTQQLISSVRLRRPSFVEEENVATWAANDGALAKRAIDRAFARAGDMLPHILAQDEAGFEQATDLDRESVTAAGYHGPVLFHDDAGPLFWARDDDQNLAAFVATQVVRN